MGRKQSIAENAMEKINNLLQSDEPNSDVLMHISALVTEYRCYDEMKSIGLLQYLK